MSSKHQIVSYSCNVLAVLTVLMVYCPDALAAEATEGWRPIFDLIMRWLNFIIIAAVSFQSFKNCLPVMESHCRWV